MVLVQSCPGMGPKISSEHAPFPFAPFPMRTWN
uniref:Uncharacterized protein n=1 Tax=Anguilla anguilla TaxID=7936 RepID=A0A0E9V281_ANGAN